VLSQQLAEALDETLAPPLARGAGGVLAQQLREALAASGKERIRDLVKNPLNGYTWWHSAKSLGIIGQNNPVAIASLVELIRNSGDEDTRRQVADSLGAIDKDNPVAFSALVELIGISQDNNKRRQAAESLEKICQDNPVAIVAVSGLKDCQTSEINENDFIRYEKPSPFPSTFAP
jgi:HEAT repeat protein